ncbi:uncharacterized protein BDW70DRAFT_144623, partial [Aspergillus foveolatus]|uniref:uncharacterized protein n=1 Tax=Aspergillus foveolatus TaxID=210207 RepID=UPI003CCD3873
MFSCRASCALVTLSSSRLRMAERWIWDRWLRRTIFIFGGIGQVPNSNISKQSSKISGSAADSGVGVFMTRMSENYPISRL